jgi:transposase InsO family protein
MTISVDIEKWETEANRGAPRLQGLARAEEIRRQIEEMLRAGVIRQSNSPYYSQVLLTLKPNGEWRFVIDFRRLNNATIKQTWPLPNIKELMRRVGQHRPKRFAKIDFTKGYWQTPLDASSRRFTAFITSFGIFEWLRVPMGACGAAGYFQWVITTVVLVGLIYSICEVYLDDILVYGRTDEEFLERLELTFQRFEQRNVSISPPKCFLGLQSVEYVGHVVDENGLRMSTSKINKVIDFKKPRTQKEMKSFLGLANYFRDHIRNYASITKPLQDMIRKYKRTTILEYTPQTEQAFIDVKEAISNCSTLHFMDSQAPIFLHTDASKYAIGAYLFQVIDMKEVPIAFLSHLLSDSEVRWSTYEKEAYAIYYAFTELRYLIRDVKFTLRTDHANLVHIRNTGSEKVIRWKLAIQEYDFVVEHIAGEKNIVADALSRIIEIPESTLEKGGDLVDTEGEATHIVLTTEHRPAMLSIPPDIYRKISSVHNTTTGHHGVERTMMKLAMMNFQADKLRTFVKEFIRRCPCCQKMSQLKPIIHTLPFTTATAQPMQRLNFDTMGPFPIQEGYEYILVIVDSFTRFTELYPMKSVTAKEAALKLLSHIGRYGCPEELLTDGGHEFANATLQELATLMGTEQLITTPYSKEENGIVERTNKEVLRFLQQIVLVRYMQDRWVDYLPLVQRILNASVHKAIGTTPASLVFGNQIQLDRNIIVPFDHNTNPSRKLSDYVKDMMRAQAHLLHMALQIQEEQNFRHITSRDDRPTEFEPNSYVLVQYPITRMGRKQPTKLHTPWRGPLRVISHIGPKYTLQNLVTGKNEDMHISCLKTFVYDPTNVNPYEIALQDSGDRLLQTVLNHRGHTRRVHTLEFLVRYYSDNPNNIVEQWEPYHKIVNNVVLHQYLQLHGMKNLIPKNHRTGNMEALL